MLTIEINIQEALAESLLLYYKSLECGDLETISTLMTQESYLVTVETLGFKRAFKDNEFRELLKQIGIDKKSLKKVEAILSNDLMNESRKYQLNIISFESKGFNRITINYNEGGVPKKLYFSLLNKEWKIDYRAGRAKS